MKNYIKEIAIKNRKPVETFDSKPPSITQLEMTPSDIEVAEQAAKALGYQQTAYTSSSSIWGLYCLPENPANGFSSQVTRGGVFFKTKEFGIVFLQDLEDLHAQSALASK